MVEEVICKITEIHNVSFAQMILRWNLQNGVDSSNSEHIQENTELYGFKLTEKEINKIHFLDRNEKHDLY